MVLAHIVQLGAVRISSGMAWCLLGAVLLFGFSAGLNHGRFLVVQREPIRLLIYGLPAFVVLWVVLQMEIRHQWSWLRKIAWLGDRSYSIYLLHVPVLAGLLMPASKWMTHSGSAEVFGVTVAVVCFIMIPVEFFYRLVEKPSHALAKRLAARLSPR
jgi:peptidoglycan/LPS O-acetylase OafA/YrhL